MRPALIGRMARSTGRAVRLTLRDPYDAALSARMAGWVVLVSGLARLMPLPVAHRLVSTRLRPASAAAIPPERLARAIDRVLRLDPPLFTGNCWRRSLVLQRFLARNGVACTVNFGLKKSGGALLGHAWLERDGQPFLEDDATAYVVTFTLPRQPAACDAPLP